MEQDRFRPVDAEEYGDRRIRVYQDGTGQRVAAYDLSVFRRSPRTILVLKLDHRGDLLIGLPALRMIRDALPQAKITVICGPWNAATLRDLGLVDEIRCYTFFPEVSEGWDGIPVEGVERFKVVCAGTFDIAVDLRVDTDTRPLLKHVNARLRCGIGSRAHYPYLDVILPSEVRAGARATAGGEALNFRPTVFDSRMPIKTALYHETDFAETDRHVVYGPYRPLPRGKLRAEFVFQLLAPRFSLPKFQIAVETVCGDANNVVGKNRVKRLPRGELGIVAVDFTNDDPVSPYEFRIYIGGRPPRTRLRFLGVFVKGVSLAPESRFQPAELHVGEQLSLLIGLLIERVRRLYQPELPGRMANGATNELTARLGVSKTGKRIVVAPFSNTSLRNWPLERYIELIGLLLAETDASILVAGAPDQATSAEQVCAPFAGRVINLAGRTSWAELSALLCDADLVIANNSGIAHLAAAFDRPTLAIYAASHQPQEWGPRGGHVRALMGMVPCSPCGYDRLELCPNDQRCMTLIEPRTVLAHALEMLAEPD